MHAASATATFRIVAESTYNVWGVGCVRAFSTNVTNAIAAGIPVGLQSRGELRWHAYISDSLFTISFTPFLTIGETMADDELSPSVWGSPRLLPPCVLLGAMTECGRSGGGRKSSLLFNLLLSCLSRSLLGTGQSRHTNILGNAESTSRGMWVPFPYATANTAN